MHHIKYLFSWTGQVCFFSRQAGTLFLNSVTAYLSNTVGKTDSSLSVKKGKMVELQMLRNWRLTWIDLQWKSKCLSEVELKMSGEKNKQALACVFSWRWMKFLVLELYKTKYLGRTNMNINDMDICILLHTVFSFNRMQLWRWGIHWGLIYAKNVWWSCFVSLLELTTKGEDNCWVCSLKKHLVMKCYWASEVE